MELFDMFCECNRFSFLIAECVTLFVCLLRFAVLEGSLLKMFFKYTGKIGLIFEPTA